MGARARAIRAAFECLGLAPFDSSQWVPMLRAMAAATNSNLGQILVGEGSSWLPISLFSESVDAGDWLAAGGPDPRINPQMAVSLRLALGQDFAEWPSVNPLIDNVLRKNDIPHLCTAKVLETETTPWFLCSLRSERQGSIDAESRTAFRRIVPATTQSLRAAAAIKNEGARLLSGALDSLTITGFILDAFGRVVALSRMAEILVQRTETLRLVRKVLVAMHAEDTRALERAVQTSARREPGTPQSNSEFIHLRNTFGQVVATGQSIPLPRDRCDIGLGAAVLLVVTERRQPSAQVLAASFSLTKAEMEVAAQLLKGVRAKQISGIRGTSQETVRTQVKNIYSKTGVRSQAAFIALAARESVR